MLKLHELIEGMQLQVLEGWPCLDELTIAVVHIDEPTGDYYCWCSNGKHWFKDHVDDAGYVYGFGKLH